LDASESLMGVRNGERKPDRRDGSGKEVRGKRINESGKKKATSSPNRFP